jgi:ferritin-like metal-binding protein YciE
MQIERLEKAFELMDKSVSASHCEAAEGLIAEVEDYLDGDGDRDVLDAAIISAAQRFEHYEIAAYGSVISYARQLDRSDGAGPKIPRRASASLGPHHRTSTRAT